MKYLVAAVLCFTTSVAYAKAIKVTTVSNLVIGTVIQGDSARVIPCGTSETSTNASFNVTGNNNTVYTITLPASATLTKSGATSLTLTNFQSYPAAGANGLLDASGTQNVYVGATLNAIPMNQTPGNYSGSFTLNVVY